MDIMETKIKSAADQIVDHIQQAILEGRILPGERLKEKEISSWLGVSRTPTREAFRILASRGLVDVTSNKGVRVTLLSRKDMGDLFELRALLELHCLGKFLRTVQPDDIQALEKFVQRMEIAVNDHDTIAYLQYSLDFHVYYISKCHNDRLKSVFSVLRNNIRTAQIFFMRKAEARMEAVDEHRVILKAINDRNVKRCKALLKSHLDNSYRRMVQFIDDNVQDNKR